MSSPNLTLVDGDFSRASPVGAPRFDYPFRMNGDNVTALFEQEFWQEIARWTPEQYKIANDVLKDFYLVDETKPVQFLANLYSFVRTYSRIPKTQTVPTSVSFTKPTVSGTFSSSLAVAFGQYRITQPDTTVAQYDIYKATAVTVDSGAPGVFAPTGGTYTITFGGATTGPLNYNDAAATIQTALNLLTPISNRGSVVVGGAYNAAGITITFTGYAQITIDTTSLTGGTISKTEALQNVGATQTLRAYIAASGIVPSALNAGSVTYSSGNPLPAQNLNYTDSNRPAIANAVRVTFGCQNGFISGGSFTITINGSTTSAIQLTTFGSVISSLQTALNTALGAGVVTVGYWPDVEAYYGATYLDATDFRSGNTWASCNFLLTFADSAATGGTYTITVGANTTTAIAYNATASTVQTALNALTSVTNRGGVVVTGALSTGFSIVFSYGDFTFGVGSLTPALSTITDSITDGTIGRKHLFVYLSSSSTRTVYAANHGITAGDQLLLISSTIAYFPAVNFTVLDANTIRLIVSPNDTFAAAATFTYIGFRTRALYSPGLTSVPAYRITRFYLPGVTAGVDSESDIPIPAAQSEGDLLKLAIFSGQGQINWQVGELVQWRNTPIISQTTTVFNSDDIS